MKKLLEFALSLNKEYSVVTYGMVGVFTAAPNKQPLTQYTCTHIHHSLQKRNKKQKNNISHQRLIYIYRSGIQPTTIFFCFFFFEIGDDASKNISLSQAYHIPMSHKKTTKTKMLFKNHIMSLDAGVFADVARHWRTANDRIWHKWKKKNIWKQIFQTYLP